MKINNTKMNNNTKESTCCPPFDAEKWGDKTVVWNNEPFIKASYPSFMHIPLPGTIGKTITKLWAIATEEGIAPAADDFIMLSNDPSPWKGVFYLNVKSASRKGDNVKISGRFETKVFDGPFRDVPKFIKKMDGIVASKGLKALDYYFYYTTCPKCAKKYGHNYIVVFALVS